MPTKKPTKKVVKKVVKRVVKGPKVVIKRRRVVKPKVTIVTDYLSAVYDLKQYRSTVKRTVAALKKLKKKSKFQAIAFRGSSGAALAYICSLQLGVPVIHVRKATDGNHFGGEVEGAFGVERYVIVDDFISSGDTMRVILKKITKVVEDRNSRIGEGYWDSPKVKLPLPECVGIVLYACRNTYAEEKRYAVRDALPETSPIIGVGR